MTLKEYMRHHNLTEDGMARLIGGITKFGIRKLMYGERGASLRVALRIQEITGGEVSAASLLKTREAA